MKKSFLLLLLTGALIYSCKQAEEKSKTTSEDSSLSPDSLKSRITFLKDSANITWKEMIKSDDQKLSDIKRLLQELTYTKSYDPGKVAKLEALTDSVKAIRYTQTNLTSEKIDQYDKATENLIKQVFLLVENNPEMASHTITETLKGDIMKSDNDVVNYRIRYDRWAKEFNGLLDNADSLGEPYASDKKLMLFELQS